MKIKMHKEINALNNKYWWFRLIWVLSILGLIILSGWIISNVYQISRISSDTVYFDESGYEKLAGQFVTEKTVNCSKVQSSSGPLGFDSLVEMDACRAMPPGVSTARYKEVREHLDFSVFWPLLATSFTILLGAYFILWIVAFKVTKFIVEGKK